ncbi:RidA family protein [Chloroflexota bacterium]
MEKQVIYTPDAPLIGSHLSQAVRAGNLVFTSGVTPRDPKTHQIVEGDIGQQTERTILNLKAILEAAGSSLDKVVKVNIYLTDSRNKPAMNKVYVKYFPKDPPARTTVEVSKAGTIVPIEIEMVAMI